MMAEYLFMALMLLQAADLYTTLRIIGNGGRELNPILVKLMGELGVVPALVVIKCVMLTILLVLLPYLPVWFMVALCAVYAAVVVHNVRVLREIDRD